MSCRNGIVPSCSYGRVGSSGCYRVSGTCADRRTRTVVGVCVCGGTYSSYRQSVGVDLYQPVGVVPSNDRHALARPVYRTDIEFVESRLVGSDGGWDRQGSHDESSCGQAERACDQECFGERGVHDFVIFISKKISPPSIQTSLVTPNLKFGGREYQHSMRNNTVTVCTGTLLYGLQILIIPP